MRPRHERLNDGICLCLHAAVDASRQVIHILAKHLTQHQQALHIQRVAQRNHNAFAALFEQHVVLFSVEEKNICGQRPEWGVLSLPHAKEKPCNPNSLKAKPSSRLPKRQT